MKNYSKKEIREIRNTAYYYAFSFDYILFGKYPKLDMRYNRSKAIKVEFDNIVSKIDRHKIKMKRKQRRILHSTPDFINIFDRPLVKDYLSNKRFITGISYDRLHFGNRNHWAKNGKDLKILNILQKNMVKNLVV